MIVGADGATSRWLPRPGSSTPLRCCGASPSAATSPQEVDRPIIALWDDPPGQRLPRLRLAVPRRGGHLQRRPRARPAGRPDPASRAVSSFDAFCDHLRRLGLLSAPVDGRRLGGWLKMGMVGTVAARGRTFLVGDAAGLVNPLQGEGIAPAMTSAAAAAEAILAGPTSAAARYRQHLAAGPGRYASVAAPLHAAAIAGSPRRVALLGRALTLPGRRLRHRCPVGAHLERPARRRAPWPHDPRFPPRPRCRPRGHHPLSRPWPSGPGPRRPLTLSR